jgi:hypothetical protein
MARAPDKSDGGERLFRAAFGLLHEVRHMSGMVRAMADFAELAEEDARGSTARPVACRAGCPYCCVLNVTVLLPEAAVIATRLTSEASRLPLLARLDHQRKKVRWMEDGERVRRQVACPFLEAGNCAIHPFRPLLCRGVTSLDSNLCRAALDPTELDVPWAVPMDMARKMIMDEAYCALARAAAACGMDARGVELAAGVWGFLEHPELGERLLAGGTLPPELWE